jgi:hypothetical protein
MASNDIVIRVRNEAIELMALYTIVEGMKAENKRASYPVYGQDCFIKIAEKMRQLKQKEKI